MIHDGKPISYSAFATAVFDAGTEISCCSIQSPGTVAVLVRDLSDSWVTTLALQEQGFTTICVPSIEILELLQVKDLAALFVQAGEREDELKHYDAVPVFAIGKPRFDDGRPFEISASADSGNEGGHILFTSGTTGSYKMYMLSAGTQQQRDLERSNYYRWDNSTRFHAVNFGLWTAIGYNLPPTLWSVGGCVLFDQQNGWPDRFFDNRPSLVWLLPDQALKLSEQKNPALLEAGNGGDLVLYICGGFLSNRVAQKLRDNVSENIVITYGSSEINSASFEQRYQSLEDLSWVTPTGNRIIEIVNEREQICPVHEEGRLRVKLTGLDTQAYLNDPGGNSSAFQNGYFYPGDMAVQREDGRFRILGRVSDVVNLAGQKRSVAPIEAELQRILEVDYVCLFSGIGSSGEPVIVIAMESAEPPDQDQLNHVGQEFSQWGEVRFAYVYPFPRTQSGTSKIDRKQLRQMLFPD